MITLLTGENNYALTEALRVKTKSFHGDIERFDGAELDTKQLPDLFMGATLFSSDRFVVIRGASVNKTLWAELADWVEKTPNETQIVLVEPSPDKRTRTYKALQKHATIQEFSLLNEASLRSWLQAVARQRGAEFSPDVLAYFLSYVGNDQWRLIGELDKLLLAEKPLTQELIRDVAEPYPEATAFELLDAWLGGNAERARDLLGLLREREDPYQFFGLLSSQVLALLALSLAGSRRPDDIARDLALHPFVVRKLSTSARELGRARVEALVSTLAAADIRIKTSGVDPWRQLEITMLSA